MLYTMAIFYVADGFSIFLVLNIIHITLDAFDLFMNSEGWLEGYHKNLSVFW